MSSLKDIAQGNLISDDVLMDSGLETKDAGNKMLTGKAKAKLKQAKAKRNNLNKPANAQASIKTAIKKAINTSDQDQLSKLDNTSESAETSLLDELTQKIMDSANTALNADANQLMDQVGAVANKFKWASFGLTYKIESEVRGFYDKAYEQGKAYEFLPQSKTAPSNQVNSLAKQSDTKSNSSITLGRRGLIGLASKTYGSLLGAGKLIGSEAEKMIDELAELGYEKQQQRKAMQVAKQKNSDLKKIANNKSSKRSTQSSMLNKKKAQSLDPLAKVVEDTEATSLAKSNTKKNKVSLENNFKVLKAKVAKIKSAKQVKQEVIIELQALEQQVLQGDVKKITSSKLKLKPKQLQLYNARLSLLGLNQKEAMNQYVQLANQMVHEEA